MSELRDFYEKTYHFKEDFVVGFDEKRIRYFFKEIIFDKAERYLDIGCGVGWSLKYCCNRGLKCFGFDISEKAIKLAKKNLSRGIEVLLANGEKLPFANESFDVVSTLGSLEHFSSPAKGIEEISRVTKKGGQVLLVFPNSYWILNKLRIYRGTEQPQEMLATLGQWARLIHKHRLEIKKTGKDIGPKILKNDNLIGIFKRLLLKLTIILPISFAYQFIFICRKK